MWDWIYLQSLGSSFIDNGVIEMQHMKGVVMSLFRTHPATEDRVARLREQASRGDY